MPQVVGVWYYALECLVAYFILGIAWYFLDRAVGVRVYRFFYDLFHKKPLPEDAQVGFLYKRKMGTKISVAVLVSTIQSLYMLTMHFDLIAELILWLLEVPAVILGFAAGAPCYRLFQRRERLYDAADRIEHDLAEVDISSVKTRVRERVGKETDGVIDNLGVVGRRAATLFRHFKIERVHRKPIEPTPAPTQRETPPQPPLDNEDPKEVLRRFTRR